MDELSTYLNKNKKIEIGKSISNGEKRYFKTALYKEDDEGFYFYRPTLNSKYIDFNPNEIIKLLIFSYDGVYIFEGLVLKTGEKLLKIRKPNTYKKIQRRGLLRQKLPIDVKITYNKDGLEQSENVNLVDISGSGISFNTNLNLIGLKRLFISFNIENRQIGSYGEIIEIRKNTNPKKELFRLSVHFISLNQKDMDCIVKHCLIHQIKTIKQDKVN